MREVDSGKKRPLYFLPEARVETEKLLVLCHSVATAIEYPLLGIVLYNFVIILMYMDITLNYVKSFLL